MRSNLLAEAVGGSRNPALRSMAMAAIILLTMFSVGGLANAKMTKQEIIGKIERDFGVKVLNVRPAQNMGEGVLAVTVMNPPGDFNEAFQINTLAVDAQSGKPVPVEAHTPQGHRQSAPPVTFRTSPRTAETP